MSFLIHMLGEGLSRLLDDPGQFAGATLRTLELASASTAAAATVGIPLGFSLGMRTGRLQIPLLAFLNAGLGIPAVALGAWVALFLLPGSPLGPLSLSNTLRGVILAQWLLATPIVIALTAAAVADIRTGSIDQARALGAGRRAQMRIAMSEQRLRIGAALFAAFGAALSEVGAVVIVGGNIRGSTNTLASTVLLDLSAGDPAAATADIVLLLVLIVAAACLFTLLQQRAGRGTQDSWPSSQESPLPRP